MEDEDRSYRRRFSATLSQLYVLRKLKIIRHQLLSTKSEIKTYRQVIKNTRAAHRKQIKDFREQFNAKHKQLRLTSKDMIHKAQKELGTLMNKYDELKAKQQYYAYQALQSGFSGARLQRELRKL